jgi:hypothetical protein
VNNGWEYIIDWLFVIYVKNKLFGSVKRQHVLMRQPNTRILAEVSVLSLNIEGTNRTKIISSIPLIHSWFRLIKLMCYENRWSTS